VEDQRPNGHAQVERRKREVLGVGSFGRPLSELAAEANPTYCAPEVIQPIVREFPTTHTPDSLAEQLAGTPGRVLLASASPTTTGGRYSFVTAGPFLTFQSFGVHCQVEADGAVVHHESNPWHLLNTLLARCELLEGLDLPFPLGGVFGYWGYDLRYFIEPRLPRRAVERLALPDIHLGFYASLVVFDHHLARSWIVSTGLTAGGVRSEAAAEEALAFWSGQLAQPPNSAWVERDRWTVRRREQQVYATERGPDPDLPRPRAPSRPPGEAASDPVVRPRQTATPSTTLDRTRFMAQVRRAQRYIQAGDIYQVNLAQRLTLPLALDGLELFRALTASSPMPYAAWLDGGSFEVVSGSPELFLRMSGAEVVTRPIKGTRPRSPEPDRDTQLAFELQTSAKEMAELVMITDLLRNDLGRVCEYGSIHVPELARLERYAYVQHLVSTVGGRLRAGVSHLDALAACFPGGSVTGAPKVRAMEIIDELEPVGRGPYTGCLGYLGFNRESQLSIIIRTALLTGKAVYFHTGAGIVADSEPEAEFEETQAKAQGFLAACSAASPLRPRNYTRSCP